MRLNNKEIEAITSTFKDIFKIGKIYISNIF